MASNLVAILSLLQSSITFAVTIIIDISAPAIRLVSPGAQNLGLNSVRFFKECYESSLTEALSSQRSTGKHGALGHKSEI